jgi:DNA invertase Pin-like site-specific DNA recombinase
VIYGYARVSTRDQKLKQQVEQLKKYGCEKIFHEKVSGLSVDNRKEFRKLLSTVQAGDKIVVCKLDRFARSLRDALNVMEELREKGVGLVILNMVGGELDTSTPNGKLMFNILASVAEFEVDLMKERQREGIEQAKKRGVYKGRPKKYTNEHAGLQHALELYKNRDNNKLTIREISQITNISESTIYRAVRKMKREEANC